MPSELLKRILLIKRYPDAMPPLSNAEMVQLAEAFLKLTNQNKALEKAIKGGLLKGDAGKSPVADKDYLSATTQKKLIEEALNRFLDDADAKIGDKALSLEKRVTERLQALRDGTDGIVTEAEIQKAAQLAYDLIELPDFEQLIRTELTANPEAIRDGLELLQGEERLDKSAIKGLDELESDINQRIVSVGGGVSRNTVAQMIADAPGGGAVDSVNGQTGVVTLDTGDIAEDTNLYYTEARVSANTDVAANTTARHSAVTVAGEDFLSLTGQQITANPIDLDNLSASGTPSASTFLRGDNTWATLTGSGDVVGPASATDNAIVRFDLTTGKLIQNSVVTIADTSGNMAGVGTLNTHTIPVGTGTFALTSDLHNALTVTDSAEIDFTLTGQDLTASLIAGSIDETKLDTSVNASLDLADSALQPTGVGSSLTTARVAGSTYSTVQHLQDIFHSTGVTSGGEITDDTDGTISVAAGTGLIRATDSATAELMWFDWSAEAGANVALTDNNMNYIYVEYNAGSPRVIATTTERTEFNTNVLLGTVYRVGTVLHKTTGARALVGDHALQMIIRMNATMPFQRESGGVVAETGTRNFSITAGAFWEGLTRFTTDAFDSSGADRFTYYYQDGVGGFTAVATQSQIDNTQYDDGTGTLATVANNRYGVHWIYLGADGDVYVVYGRGSYTLTEAEAAGTPATVPPLFGEDHAKLIGKVVIEKSAASFTDIQSAFATSLSASNAAEHNTLVGLQGGAAAEYFHLTSSEYTGTGTGAFVRETSPTLTTPNIGTPSAGTLTNATGLPTTGLVDDAVTNAKLANVATSTIKGRVTAATGDPEDLTPAQVRTLLNVADGATANTGDVAGPASSTDNAIARFDSTTGKLLQNGTLSSSDVSTGAVTLATIGNNDLVLQTGNATTGAITITDGANGNITIDPDGTGQIILGTGSVRAPSSIDFELQSASGTILFEPNNFDDGSYAIGIAHGDFTVYNDSGSTLARFNRTFAGGGYSSGRYLDMEGNGISGLVSLADQSENELITFTGVTSAVNQIGIDNAATANAPILRASGGDTNISLNLVPKGTGRVQADGVNIPTISSTDTLTNKTLTSPNINEAVALTATATELNVLDGITATTAELNYTDGVTSNIQTQLDAKAGFSRTTDASTATPTPTGGSAINHYSLTALATAPTFAAPSGTPAEGNRLTIRIHDSGTARALAWNAIYTSTSNATLPTTTTIGLSLLVGFIYDSTDSVWRCVAVTQQV